MRCTEQICKLLNDFDIILFTDLAFEIADGEHGYNVHAGCKIMSGKATTTRNNSLAAARYMRRVPAEYQF